MNLTPQIEAERTSNLNDLFYNSQRLNIYNINIYSLPRPAKKSYGMETIKRQMDSLTEMVNELQLRVQGEFEYQFYLFILRICFVYSFCLFLMKSVLSIGPNARHRNFLFCFDLRI